MNADTDPEIYSTFTDELVPLTVNVRSFEVESGTQRNCAWCPISVALMQIIDLNRCIKIHTEFDQIQLWGSEGEYCAQRLSPEVYKWLHDFDGNYNPIRSMRAPPISFTIQVPKCLVSLKPLDFKDGIENKKKSWFKRLVRNIKLVVKHRFYLAEVISQLRKKR
jgi:hypothetical protein